MDMFFTDQKLKNRVDELSRYRYRDRVDLKPLLMKLETEDNPEENLADPKGWDEVAPGQTWSGRDTYLWLAMHVRIPEEWQHEQVVGLFDFGRTGEGNNSGFEALLYVNGRPYQGIDSNHQEVFFSQDLGSELDLRFRLWSGLEGGGSPQIQHYQIKQAQLCCLDQPTDHLYYTAWAALQTAAILKEEQPERWKLLELVNRAIMLIDWRRPGSEAFYHSVTTAARQLDEELEQLKRDHHVQVYCVGHSHLDVAWLWRVKHTREKAARTFSTVLRLMERFPEYYYLQTQPQLYAYLQQDYPHIYEQVKKRVQEGRWEVGGAMWLEADCNLVSGESLVRQILYGIRFIEQEFGYRCRYLWLPDVFGYSWALPQILKKAGIEAFVTTKLSWNQYNRLPHDTFFWRGMDGSEILTHFITTPYPPEGEHGFMTTYNGVITPASVHGIWDHYQDKALNQHLLLAYGYGDGGGGPNRDMLEMRRRLDKMPGLPHVKTSRVDHYLSKLLQRVQQTESYMHVWDGELYLECHRGTYTSQAEVKKWNRKLELMLRELEWLSVLAAVHQGQWKSYPQPEIMSAWEVLLRNQFHDILPGSSIREVYEDTLAEYRFAGKLCQILRKDQISQVTSGATKTYTVFNGANWPRTDIVKLPVITETGGDGSEGCWVDADGQPLLSQKTEQAWLVLVPDVPSMGYTTIKWVKNARDPENSQLIPFTIGDGQLTTPFYRISWDKAGHLTSVYDVQYGREVLADAQRGNVLQVFEDKPLNFEAWDIDLFYQEKMSEINQLQACYVQEMGPLQAVIRFEWAYQNSYIKQDLIVYAHSRRIDFVTSVDWHEQQQLLKVAFPVAIRNHEATYHIQFGNVKRPTHWNTSWDYAKFESVAHQWADFSERNYGVSLLNDCKYGYDIKDQVMRLSLIKSATYPDPQADQGRHQFTYALYPHQGDWYVGRTVQEAWQLNHPLTYDAGRMANSSFTLFEPSVDHVFIDAVKKSEDGEQVVVRLHEFAGMRNTVTLRSDFIIDHWQECNLLEEPLGDRMEGPLTFIIQPYEIKTFFIKVRCAEHGCQDDGE